ncbi:PTS glucitol/sorbitol transporter subunit IIB [Candidatus Enterococcus ferrettii]|uniref:PTS system, glucitol/sorbitol-specific IIB component n=1 Tax=Candidatus Enterococcus ferrettii TaxID=2815324 RepID=A0ABV0EQ37_9ENTE|nr:PTS glucitol/sorbitol transporter subunit IIB [Enterococcus sp. 665A]MBO1338186.1 PTS glucitol/sorbitol transporter subunit IIB [Enterococcus sp. 665A]
MYNSIKISHGNGGWGGPLVVKPTDEKKYVISVTTGGVHPVAERIAELSGATVIDQFTNPIDTGEAFCAVIDCAGIARCGTYPKLGIPTVNVKLGSPSGPLAKYITEDIFVSGVVPESIALAEGDEAPISSTVKETAVQGPKKSITKEAREKYESNKTKSNGMMDAINKVGVGVGNVINVIYQAARDTVDTLVRNIIPFMLFVSVLIGIINYTGFADVIANLLSPLAGSIWGLIAIGLFCSIPFLSPLICPGAIIASVISLLIGNQIANGTIPAHYALPALYAVNCQVGSDFAPVGLTLMEAKPETIENGVPAFLIGKLLTGPLAIIIAYFASFGL